MTGIQARVRVVTATSDFSRVILIVVVLAAAVVHLASISAISAASSASSSIEVVVQAGDLALRRRRRALGRQAFGPVLAGGGAELAAARPPRANARRAGRRGSNRRSTAARRCACRRPRPRARRPDPRRRRSCRGAWSPWPRTCRASLAISASALLVGDRGAAGGERLGRLAGPAVQLEVGVGRQLDRQAAREVVAQVALDRRELGLARRAAPSRDGRRRPLGLGAAGRGRRSRRLMAR